MVLLGWVYAASYAPGVAPRAVRGVADQMQPLVVECSTAPCPSPAFSSVGVASDGDDTLVLLGRPAAAAPGLSVPPAPSPAVPASTTAAPGSRPPTAGSTAAAPTSARSAPARSTTVPGAGLPSTAPPAAEPVRVVLSLEGATRPVVLQRRSIGPGWQVDAGGRSWTTLASRAGALDVLRLSGGTPSARWSATVDDLRVPTQGSGPVAELTRPRDALAERAAQWLAVAVFVALFVALHGYHSASRRALYLALRAIGFGLLTVFGAAPLVSRLQAAAPDVPGLLTIVAILAPLLALAVAAAAARALTAALPANDAARGLRLVTALAALALLVLLVYVGELAAARYFPGLSW